MFSLILLLSVVTAVLSVHHRHAEGGPPAVQRPLPRDPGDGRHQPGGALLTGVQDLPRLDQLHEHHQVPPHPG